MPLVATMLQTEILKLTDASREDFVGFPATAADAGQNWSNAFGLYVATLITPPGLGLVAFEAGQAVAAEAFTTAALAPPVDDAELPPNPLVMMIKAYMPFLKLDTPAAVSVPPTTPPPVVSALAKFVLGTDNPVPPAESLANTLDAWMRTGTFTTPDGTKFWA